MKRQRYASEQIAIESFNIANVLMLLSRGSGGGGEVDNRVFECKTCNRQFNSFQALGGHRASHKKPRLNDESQDRNQTSQVAKPKVHECSICGLEFAIGQALGGHMRRHRGVNEGFGHGLVEKIKDNDGGKRVVVLDLNLPPLDEETECRKLGLGLGFWSGVCG